MPGIKALAGLAVACPAPTNCLNPTMTVSPYRCVPTTGFPVKLQFRGARGSSQVGDRFCITAECSDCVFGGTVEVVAADAHGVVLVPNGPGLLVGDGICVQGRWTHSDAPPVVVGTMTTTLPGGSPGASTPTQYTGSLVLNDIAKSPTFIGSIAHGTVSANAMAVLTRGHWLLHGTSEVVDSDTQSRATVTWQYGTVVEAEFHNSRGDVVGVRAPTSPLGVAFYPPVFEVAKVKGATAAKAAQPKVAEPAH
jgi:hypothetical protein